jgi:hypothetical protein
MTVQQPGANVPSELNRQSLSRVRGRPFEKGNGGRRPGSKNTPKLREMRNQTMLFVFAL